MSDDDVLAAADRRIAELEREIAISRVRRETGFSPELLGNGRTAEEIEQIATDALGWRAAAAPPPTSPPTSALPASIVTSADRIEMPHRITTHDELRRFPPAERMRAYREGRLMHLGAYPPQRAGSG